MTMWNWPVDWELVEDSEAQIVSRLAKRAMKSRHQSNKFIPGESQIPVTGKVFGSEEISAAIEASLEFWLTAGHFTEEFERKIASIMRMRAGLMVNSGSSANLLALSSLTSGKLGDRALKPGDEIITVAAGFPTTVILISLDNEL